MDLQAAVKILAPLLLAFPKSGMDTENIKVYAIALSELGEAELQAGVLKCMRTSKFFPSIAEIMDASLGMVKAITGTQEKSADEAWNEVQKQMVEAFIYKKPVFSTPEIEQAALAMGWTSLCNTPVEDMGTARAQFRKFYESSCQRSREKWINDNVISIMGGEERVKSLIGNVTNALPDTKRQLPEPKGA